MSEILEFLVSAPDEGRKSSLFLPRHGKPCPYVVLKMPKARRLAALELIISHLEFSEAAIGTLLEAKPNDVQTPSDVVIKKALYLAAIVSYGKCFVTAEGRKVRLNPKDHLKAANADQKKIHEEIMETRHRYVAHGGTSSKEDTQTRIDLDPDRCEDWWQISCLSTGTIQTTEETLGKYLEVIGIVRNSAEKAYKKTLSAVKELVRSRPIGEWYKGAIYPPADEEAERPHVISKRSL